MTRLDTSQTISGFVGSPIATGVVDDSLLSSGELHQNQLAWGKIIDDQLIEWATNPSQLEDDGVEPPSGAIISLACGFVRAVRDRGWPPPHRVVPDGDGGITFERKDGAVFQTIEIEEDGSIELITFENSRLVSREPIQ